MKFLQAQFRLPVTGYRLPVTGYQLPVTGYQLPVTGYRLPITVYRLPITLLLLWILSIFLPQTSYSQTGIPYFTNYPPKVYKAEGQNWAIIQDKRGVMYFGNTIGLLEYDGSTWRLIRLSNNSGIRSLALDNNGRVWVGGLGDFGYLKADPQGKTGYYSLLNKMPPDNRQFADVWKAFAMGNKVIFQTFSSLFIVEKDSVRMKKAERDFEFSFLVDNTFYVRQNEKGLLELKGEELVLINGGELFRNKPVVSMLPFGRNEKGEQKVLITTWGKGNYIMIPGKKIVPFLMDADSILNANVAYNGAIVTERSLALGTIKGGVTLIDYSGNLLKILNKSTGLMDDMVISSYTDYQNALWLGLNNGISRVEVLSPVTYFGENFGLVGSVQAITRFKKEIFIATSQGLFKLKNISEQMLGNGGPLSNKRNAVRDIFYKFEPIPRIDVQAWWMLKVNTSLLTATNKAVYNYENDSVQSVLEHKAFCLLRSRKDTNRVYCGLMNGLGAIYLENGKWIDEGKVENINEQIKTMVEGPDGSLWLGTAIQGVLHVKFPSKMEYRQKLKDEKPVVEIGTAGVFRFDSTSGIPSGENGVFLAGKDIVLGTQKGIYRVIEDFNTHKIKFEPDTIFGVNKLYNFPVITSMVTDFNNHVWIRAGEATGVAMRKSDGKSYRWHTRPFLRIPAGPVWTFYPEDDGVTWVGGDNGLVRYDASILKNYGKKYYALIRKVTISTGKDSVIFYGTYADKSGTAVLTQPSEMEPDLPFKNNSLIFEFSAPSFDDETANRFQYKLDGFDQEWSEWSAETKKEYTNLNEGQYVFRLKARNIYEHESEEGDFRFQIKPPFYKTWWFFGGQLIFIGLLFGGSVYFSRGGSSNKMAGVLVTISLIIVFEYVQNFVEDNFSNILGGIAFFKVLLNIILAIMLLPLENIIKKLIHKKRNVHGNASHPA